MSKRCFTHGRQKVQHGVASQGADSEGDEDGEEVSVELAVEARDEDDADQRRQTDDDDSDGPVAELYRQKTARE